jgi:spermidine synthase
VALARGRLGLRTGPALRVRTGDARVTLRDEPDDSADLVIGDAFGGRAVPWHLTTLEFVEDIDRVLRPDGIYALNIIDYPPLKLARAETATLLEAFEHVAVIADPDPGGNLVLLASDRPLPEGTLDAAVFAGDAQTLRDDDAPADQLLTPRA